MTSAVIGMVDRTVTLPRTTRTREDTARMTVHVVSYVNEEGNSVVARVFRTRARANAFADGPNMPEHRSRTVTTLEVETW